MVGLILDRWWDGISRNPGTGKVGLWMGSAMPLVLAPLVFLLIMAVRPWVLKRLPPEKPNAPKR